MKNGCRGHRARARHPPSLAVAPATAGGTPPAGRAIALAGTQMVGKLRMALAPHQNHWWHVPLYVDARGLTTGLMPAGSLGLEVRFDVIAHELVFERTDGTVRAMALRPRSVADFSREFVTVLTALDVPARIHPVPVELPEVIPFDEDETHASYDADAAARFWRSLTTIAPIMARFRGEWEGKASPCTSSGARSTSRPRASAGGPRRSIPAAGRWPSVDG